MGNESSRKNVERNRYISVSLLNIYCTNFRPMGEEAGKKVWCVCVCVCAG